MTSDSKSPEEIEREIERERAGLKDSIEDLQDRFSFDGVVQQVGDQFREHGGDFGRSVAQSARDNPVALALTGIGLAWMMFGGNRKADTRDDRYTAPRGSHTDRLDHDVPDYAARRGAAYSGPKSEAARNTGRQPNWARDWGHDELGASHGATSSGRSLGDRVSGAGASIRDTAGSAKDAIASGSSSAAQSVSSGAASARDTAYDAASSARDTVGNAARGVRDTAGNVWSSASQRAEALQARLSEGTEHLSEEARERIAAARARAIDARDEAARRLSRGSDQVADFYDEHPLVVGAVAFAVGAAIAGALPRTRIEDEYVGGYSDDLYDEAERIYSEEVEKAQKVVKAGVDEAKNVASEFKSDVDSAAPGDQSATDAAVSKAKSAANRVADAAKDKADEENLGNISKDIKNS
ncbi:DUF3618 domain-containing protein [Roseovarius sp. Pro17]|uniref:DUF3618 domain-containing protein n=1 Tax=Roseovarius sp. Pro17 TaxID=3108175 RepID=UPI002D77C160|nr:DUF3618 domain-containing protein [Roseovarius sp. Pro17]